MEHDKRLMGRVARGDEAAFTELVGRYGGRLLGVARRLLGSRADAEDAVQRALLKCYLSAGTYQAEWAVSTWLYRILTMFAWTSCDGARAGWGSSSRPRDRRRAGTTS